MKTIKQMLMTVAVLLCSATVNAYDFEMDGIYYNIISASDLTVKVTSGDNKYSGEVIIPSTVTYKSKVLAVTEIGWSAFRGCSSLTSITIPENVTNICDGAFLGCTSLKEVVFEDGFTVLSMGLNYEGEGLFYDCPLEKVYLGRDLSYRSDRINGFSPFFGREKLKSITIGDCVTEIGRYAFYDCCNLTSVTISKSVASIGERAFYDCSNLTSIIIPEGVTSIGSYAFYNCSSLTSFTIPEEVTLIGKVTFKGCSSLTSITIGKSVASIDQAALYECEALTSIYLMGGTPPSVGSDNFTGASYADITVFVPQGTLAVYQAAEVWENFWDIQEHDIPVDSDIEIKKCATPTIIYGKGKLSIASETEGVEFVTEITNSDITNHFTSTIELAVTYNIKTYAKLSGYANSDMAYATLCWIESDDANSDLTQIKSTPVLIESHEGNISICGVKADTEITVYDINGYKVSAAVANGDEVVINTSLNKNDTAVIHIGDKAIKIVMR